MQILFSAVPAYGHVLRGRAAPLEARRDSTAAALEELQASHQKSVIDLDQLSRDVVSVLDANRTPAPS